VLRLWKEPKVRWAPSRTEKLEAELARLARFVGLEQVIWTDQAAADLL
jgi:hypothetical protein